VTGESCARCGRSRAEDDALTAMSWVTDVDERGSRQYCPRCARENIRGIEAKLKDEWW
jgi:hypothetical protein